VGGLIFALITLAIRVGYLFIMAKVKGHRFAAFDRPIPRHVGPPSNSDPAEYRTTPEYGGKAGDEEAAVYGTTSQPRAT
jgi:hypothetical protein